MLIGDSVSRDVAGGAKDLNELEKRGLCVALDLCRDPDIKPEGDRIGEIFIGQMTVPDLQDISWSDLFPMMQETGARERVPGLHPHQDELQPIHIESDVPVWTRPLPEPGSYEIGVWRLGGEQVRGGLAGRIADARHFRPEMAARELQASGFTGAVNLFILAHVTKTLLMLEGRRFTLGEANDRFLDRGKGYMPYYSFDRETVNVLAMIPIVWSLRFAKIDFDYNAKNMVFGFRPTAK